MIGNRGGYFALDAEDIIEFAIVAFGPKVFVRGHADELDIDVCGIANLLDATFKNVGYAELLADFAQIVRRAFVFLSRGARDDLQSRDLR